MRTAGSVSRACIQVYSGEAVEVTRQEDEPEEIQTMQFVRIPILDELCGAWARRPFLDVVLHWAAFVFRAAPAFSGVF
jgi:hypothetical protein